LNQTYRNFESLLVVLLLLTVRLSYSRVAVASFAPRNLSPFLRFGSLVEGSEHEIAKSSIWSHKGLPKVWYFCTQGRGLRQGVLTWNIARIDLTGIGDNVRICTSI
jgi:hypothetical protein